MRRVATILGSILYYLQITEMVLWVREKDGREIEDKSSSRKFYGEISGLGSSS